VNENKNSRLGEKNENEIIPGAVIDAITRLPKKFHPHNMVCKLSQKINI